MSRPIKGYENDPDNELLMHLDEYEGDDGYCEVSQNNRGHFPGVPIITGKIRNARHFDNTNGYLDAVSVTVPHGNDLSVEAFIRPMVNNPKGSIINVVNGPFSSGHIVYSLTVNIAGAFSYPTFIVKTNIGDYLVIATTPILQNVWYHLAGTYNHATGAIKIYINGTLNNQHIYAPSFIDGSPDSIGLIARSPGAFPYTYFRGDIDEIRVSVIERTSFVFPYWQNTPEVSDESDQAYYV
jgi:hypothetical protein